MDDKSISALRENVGKLGGLFLENWKRSTMSASYSSGVGQGGVGGRPISA